MVDAPMTQYIVPTIRLSKAQETMKIIKMGRGTFGLRFRTDIVHALGIKRGDLLFVTLEKPPEFHCQNCNNSL